MKARFTTLAFALCALVFLGCSKSETVLTQEDAMVVYLTSAAGNRVWMISKYFENGIEIPLTIAQLNYTKTYTISTRGEQYRGTFQDQSGDLGTWVISKVKLEETITNNLSGSRKRDYTIRELKDKYLDIELTQNGITARYILYAN